MTKRPILSTLILSGVLALGCGGKAPPPTAQTTTKTETTTTTSSGEKDKSTTTETKTDQADGSQTVKATVKTERTVPPPGTPPPSK